MLSNLTYSPLLILPFVLLSGWFFDADVDHGRLRWWAVSAVVFTLVASATVLASAGSRRSTALAWIRWPLAASLGLVGVVFGLASWVGVSGDREVTLLFTMFPATYCAIAVVVSAGRRDMFLVMVVPALVITALTLHATGDSLLRNLAAIVPFYLVALFALHHSVSRTEIRAVVEGSAADRLRVQYASDRNELVVVNSQLHESNLQLAHQAKHDPLTGLLNRRGTLEALESALAASRRGGSVALLFLDLDRFKAVNDAIGHRGGDRFICIIADRIARSLDVDEVPGRIGGDEFVVLLNRVENEGAATAAAERVRLALAGWIEVDGVTLTVTPSIGVATSRGPETTSDDLLRHADAALYRAKTRGRNRVEVFDDSLHRNLRRKRTFEGELREGIRTGAVVPWYQPTVDLETGRIVGAEALARWHHPELGLLNAGEFIPLAEEVGLIDRIGDLMVLGVMAARAELSHLGVVDDFRVHFNVSPRQLARPDQFTRMKRLANRERCEMHWLGAEITESAVLFDEQLAREQLLGARELGLRIDIDDFGTGYSSLSLLRRLPIDGVKIDRSFVCDVATDPADAAIVGTVIDLTRRLGLSVVAEGVETTAQVAVLRSFGCRVAQGFLWSPAVPLESLSRLIVADTPKTVEARAVPVTVSS